MKRNPLYSPNFKTPPKIKFTDNGTPYFTWNCVPTDYGYRTETKQEKFNRIFDVEDAKPVK